MTGKKGRRPHVNLFPAPPPGRPHHKTAGSEIGSGEKNPFRLNATIVQSLDVGTLGHSAWAWLGHGFMR